jgi:hypothetical protein
VKQCLSVTLLVLVAVACSGAPGPTLTPTPNPTPTPSPTTAGLYLRAWYSQALPPEVTFGWLPVLTVSDGVAIDGNVAVPAIYPGPLLIVPNARAISAVGQAALVEQAREWGLLEGAIDFSGGRLAPGAQVAHVLIVVDGTSREIIGDPTALVRCLEGEGLRCVPEPGTPGAFALFWQRLSYLDDWLGTELGAVSSYVPERLAVVTTSPEESVDPIVPTVADWSLDKPFAEFGLALPAPPGARCATVSGTDLEALLPVLHSANQLTRFVDERDELRSLIVRVLVPDEPSPCADES